VQSSLAIEFLEDPFPANLALSGAVVESSQAGEFKLYNLDAIRKSETPPPPDNRNILNIGGMDATHSSVMELIPVKHMSHRSSTLPSGIFHIAQRPNTNQLAVTTLSTQAHIFRLQQKEEECEGEGKNMDIDMMDVEQEVNEHDMSSQQQNIRAGMRRANGCRSNSGGGGNQNSALEKRRNNSASRSHWELHIEYDLAGHTGGCATVRINNNRAVTACFDGRIRVFELPPSSPQNSVSHTDEPSTTTTATAAANNVFSYNHFNINNGITMDRSNHSHQPEALHSIATFLDDPEHTQQPPLSEQNRGVCGLALSSTSHRIVSGSNDMQIKVWDTTTGRITLRLGGCMGWPWWVEGLDPELNAVTSASTDGYVRVWDLRAGQQSLSLYLSADSTSSIFPVATVVPRIDGNYLVAGCFDTSIYVIDKRMGRVVKDLRGHTARLARLALRGDTLLSCAFEGNVALHGFE
jgi:WD40 repeat protein